MHFIKVKVDDWFLVKMVQLCGVFKSKFLYSGVFSGTECEGQTPMQLLEEIKLKNNVKKSIEKLPDD
jgi:hypothetical protein